MTDKTKLNKNTTLVTESFWSSGERVFTGRLKYPKQDANEEECIRFEGTKLYINKDVLSKYGIEMVIE